jgi:acetoacetate decarboxylase
MPYVLSREEFRWLLTVGPFLAEFPGAEMLAVRFRTDRDVVARLLPRPLTAPVDAYGLAFVAHYPDTNFGVTYREGALCVDAGYRGETGFYCLAMPVDNDVAMVEGREVFGYPKKVADHITLERSEQHVVGSVVRRGSEILRIEGDLGGQGGSSPTRVCVPASTWPAGHAWSARRGCSSSSEPRTPSASRRRHA